MDRKTYKAISALRSYDSAKAAMEKAQANMAEALEQWVLDRPTLVSPQTATRDAEAMLRQAALLLGEMKEETS